MAHSIGYETTEGTNGEDISKLLSTLQHWQLLLEYEAFLTQQQPSDPKTKRRVDPTHSDGTTS